MLAIVTIALGNTKDILNYYGLGGANHLVHDNVTNAVSTGLGKIDGFSFTNSVVTFLVWAVVGAICFTIAQMLGGVYHEVREERQVSSNRYIHPQQFRRSAFWARVISDFLTAMLGLAFLFAGLILLLTYVFPVALTNTRSYLVGFSYDKIGNFLLGFALLYGWLLLMTIILKFTLNRHRLRT